MPERNQRIAQVRTNKTGTTGDEDSHAGPHAIFAVSWSI
jgi:hypothetical protein